MRPIDERLDLEFSQAILCVEYRIPKSTRLGRMGFLHTLALRYGMLGVAAAHNILSNSDRNERLAFVERLPAWSDFVEEHVRWEIGQKLPVSVNASTPSWVARQSAEPFHVYIAMQRRGYPLDECLRAVCEDYLLLARPAVRRELSMLKRRAAVTEFLLIADDSRRYAENFFERRLCDLDEVPEIALLDD